MSIYKKRKSYAPKKATGAHGTARRSQKWAVAPSRPLRNSLRSTMLYSETITLGTSAVGTGDQYIFSANGTYDPNITSTGNQPRGWDQLIALYDHFIVTRSKLECWVVQTDNNPLMMHLSLRDAASHTLSTRDCMEYEPSIPKVVGYQGSSNNYVALECDPIQFLSRDFGDPDLKNSAGSNPAEQAYFYLNTFHPSGDANISIRVEVRLTYEGYFIEPKFVSGS